MNLHGREALGPSIRRRPATMAALRVYEPQVILKPVVLVSVILTGWNDIHGYYMLNILTCQRTGPDKGGYASKLALIIGERLGLDPDGGGTGHYLISGVQVLG